MTRRLSDRIVLGAAALVLAGVGAGSVAVPEAFYADYGIDVSSTELASELRASGGALLFLGLLVGSGGVWGRATFPASVVAAVVLLGYASGRAASVLADGAPRRSVILAAAIEVVVGGAASWVALRTRPRVSPAAAS